MPIRAYCTICSDFFDHSRDVAAIHCGHTFHYECLLQWFQTAPTKTCPQCRKQVSTRHIINKLFFDIGGEEDGDTDPESMQNELNRVKALLSSREREWRDKEKAAESLKQTLEKQKKDLDTVRKDIKGKEMLCSALRQQMMYLETQQKDADAAKEEARRLRTKMKTLESMDVLLQGIKEDVESMVTDMGVSVSTVEQLSIYCISLKKEYDNLKGSLRSSNEMCEKLKREVLSYNNKLQKATLEGNRTKDDMKSLQNELARAEKEITSLKKKVDFLQKTLSTPTRTNEALSRLVFESPAPLELRQPHLHQPADKDDIDLNLTFDVSTPDEAAKKPAQVLKKKKRLDTSDNASTHTERTSSLNKVCDNDSALEPFLKNSLLFRKKTFGSMLDPQRKPGAIRTGYDGLGGRTKFFMPSLTSEIRPLMKAKRKKVIRPPGKTNTSLTLDCFLE